VNQPLITPELRRKVVDSFPLGPTSIHGPDHWDRVLENAIRIREETGADMRVLELFALFHDSLRQNDIVDPGHGRRGGEYARKLRSEAWFDLEDAAFDLLFEACAGHTEGGSEGDLTIITCWDADRLDLWRCGIRPDPSRMCTETARRPEVIAWAMQRSGGPPDGVEIRPR
jgi:uncharacterized protein